MKLYQLYDKKNQKFVSLGSWSRSNNNMFGNGGKVWSKIGHIRSFITQKICRFYHPEDFEIVEYEVEYHENLRFPILK